MEREFKIFAMMIIHILIAVFVFDAHPERYLLITCIYYLLQLNTKP